MKITTHELKQIIKEELQAVYSEELTDKDKEKKQRLEKDLEDLEHK